MRVVVRLNLRGLGEVITGKIRRMAGGEKEGTSVDVVICNLCVEGRIRYFPLVGHPLMLACFANMPKVRFDINVSGLSMTAMPQMKRFIGSIISEALGRKLIFPYAIALELGSLELLPFNACHKICTLRCSLLLKALSVALLFLGTSCHLTLESTNVLPRCGNLRLELSLLRFCHSCRRFDLRLTGGPRSACSVP